MITFIAYGDPAPQGSKKAVGRSSTGRILLAEVSKKVKPWRDIVRAAALDAAYQKNLTTPLVGPLEATVLFTLTRPQRVPRDRQGYPATYPDLDKLLRSTFDALTHNTKPGIIKDDSQIVSLAKVAKGYTHTKGFLTKPGAYIQITPIYAIAELTTI